MAEISHGKKDLPWQGSITTKVVVILFQLRHSQRAIDRLSWFANIYHLFKSIFWGEGVSVLFSGSMRSLYKIYGKLRTHLKINSRLLVIREAETLNRWKGEKEQCTAWGHYQFTEKLQDAQSMSCVIDVKGPSAFSVPWLHIAMKLQACLMEASHISCFYPCLPMCLHTTAPVFAHMLILFFCWDFKNWVLFVALVIQKLDSEPESMVYSWQNEGQNTLDNVFRKRILPVLKNKLMFHISLNLMLFWCLYI